MIQLNFPDDNSSCKMQDTVMGDDGDVEDGDDDNDDDDDDIVDEQKDENDGNYYLLCVLLYVLLLFLYCRITIIALTIAASKALLDAL